MKVTTLACIQGAWLPDCSPKRVLDIGSGTGILSLMTAQKIDAEIDAVEIEEADFSQLKENVSLSPWSERINCFHNDISDFADENSSSYDLIISNPPFYQNQLKSPNNHINSARHDSSLSLVELMDISSNLIKDEGFISILLPICETKDLIRHAEGKSLFLMDQLTISDTALKGPIAIISIFSKNPSNKKIKKLLIKNNDGSYSSDFSELLAPYYLNL
jgi:tRNA1Val (adenine37-N6)-methyltransferase